MKERFSRTKMSLGRRDIFDWHYFPEAQQFQFIDVLRALVCVFAAKLFSTTMGVAWGGGGKKTLGPDYPASMKYASSGYADDSPSTCSVMLFCILYETIPIRVAGVFYGRGLIRTSRSWKHRQTLSFPCFLFVGAYPSAVRRV